MMVSGIMEVFWPHDAGGPHAISGIAMVMFFSSNGIFSISYVTQTFYL